LSIATNDMTAVVHEYIRARNSRDRGPWLALHAENSVHEDPVGGTNNDVGLDQIAAHWDATQALNIELLLDEPVITGGQEAIAIMHFRRGPINDRQEGGRIVLHFVFDNDGKIAKLRSFHGF
jgi:SnoaL-like domain